MSIWILFLGVLAFGCTSQGNWKHSQIDGAEPQFTSHRLSYHPSDTFHPMRFEIIRKSSFCKGYLITEQKPIPPYEQDLQKAFVSLTIEGNTSSYIVTRYEEGYRLLLPQELIDTLIASLSQGKTTVLEVANDKVILSPEGFTVRYKEFQKNFSLSKFVHSPF